MKRQRILITGGAGFIGSHFVRHWLRTRKEAVINLDSFGISAQAAHIFELDAYPGHHHILGSIGEFKLVRELLADYDVCAVVNFAAETHVDRSIDNPLPFIESNITDCYRLLEAARVHVASLPDAQAQRFRFLQVSTDEVYGSLDPDDPPVTEESRYAPNNPYAASKAAADHLVRSFHETYGLPVLTVHPANNYGTGQYPEKLIPFMVRQALAGEPLTVYGDGLQLRDWLHVEDNCRAILTVLEKGRVGEHYNVGADNPVQNIEVVARICTLLDEMAPRDDGRSYREQVRHVPDRPGHDRRYAMDSSKIRQLGWFPQVDFGLGFMETIRHYVEAFSPKGGDRAQPGKA